MSERPGSTHETPSSPFDAVILDLDGVVTDTASVHARAWKRLFDEALPRLAPTAQPFDDADYRSHLDGRTREDGIREFLASRAITQDAESIAVLALQKQRLFEAELATTGVSTVPGTVEFLRAVRGRGIRTAVVTSSRNAERVLEAAGVGGLFDVRVDGNDLRRLRLAGKPSPAPFLEACRALAVEPDRTVMVEDAVSGVRAGAAGGFGLVVGLDRSPENSPLLVAGADVVVRDLRDLDLDAAGRDGATSQWMLSYDGFDAAQEGTREALCTLANGYWGTRGAAAETDADGVHYPGTYFAGVYNTVRSERDGVATESEAMVNAPNWLPLWFRVDGGAWFAPSTARLLDYRQELDLRRALLTRDLRFTDDDGRITRVRSRRLVSQASAHTAMIETTIEPENWSGALTVRSAIDGRVTNRNAAGSPLLTRRHLAARKTQELDAESILLEMETIRSGIHIATAARTRAFDGAHRLTPTRSFLVDEEGWVAHELDLTVTAGHGIRIEKVVVVRTSRDRAISSPAEAAATLLGRTPGADALLAAHERAWRILWDEFRVELRSGERQSLALNLNTFHVLQTLASVTADLDAGVPARGLHGEGYGGHVFWDELFVYPSLTLRRPDLSRTLLGYRYRRLDEARSAARAEGLSGAMFPWQSGIDGREVTPRELFNPLTGTWMPDNSYRQRHVGLGIAYSAWQHYQSTGDLNFLVDQGAELVIEVARYFADLAGHEPATGRYSISGVMGPDEFHDGYPDEPGKGLRNNAYTNVMAAWVLRRAADTVTLLASRSCRPLWDRLGLLTTEADRWLDIGRRLTVPFLRDGAIAQFEGYESLAELDWERYRSRYGSIGRLDLILNAEGDSTNRYKVSKQPDALMLLYLFSAEELRELLGEMGYPLPAEAVVRTVNHYTERSTYGSTLSNVVHSWIEARQRRERSWDFLTRALESDLSDIQGGSTRDGIHVGAMAGSIDMVGRCYPGLELRSDMLWLHPLLPPEIDSIAFDFTYRSQQLRLELSHTLLTVSVERSGAAPITVVVDGLRSELAPGESRQYVLDGT
ncbi:beta-phosphoglucomutase family hydrolase [Lacisediminihabitans sp.]|uniref:beta-phosphoglucomutase family hydrolase n=1 Tax=Lacisediminihabitans sp. TaxID=2787631 RepID=UPI00374D3373